MEAEKWTYGAVMRVVIDVDGRQYSIQVRTVRGQWPWRYFWTAAPIDAYGSTVTAAGAARAARRALRRISRAHA